MILARALAGSINSREQTLLSGNSKAKKKLKYYLCIATMDLIMSATLCSELFILINPM